jgi:solute:Na+ symporter, SSS family
VPVLLLVGTLVCTWIGSGSLFGGAGLAYRVGIAELWFSFGGWLGLLVAFFLAPASGASPSTPCPTCSSSATTRRAAARHARHHPGLRDHRRLPVPRRRLDPHHRHRRRISPEMGMYIVCITIVLFTALAGMMSIVTVDILNGIVITLGHPHRAAVHGRGRRRRGRGPRELPEGHTSVLGGHNALWVIGVALPTFLLILGESGMYQKFFSAKNERAAKQAVVGMVAASSSSRRAGAARHRRARRVPGPRGADVDRRARRASETVILYIARHGLPALVGALLLAAAIAIVLSTGNTFLLVPSTNVSRDIYERFINPDATERQKLNVQRLFIVLFGGLGLLLLTQFQTVLAMALYAYSLVGASLTPALLAAFLWKRVTPARGRRVHRRRPRHDPRHRRARPARRELHDGLRRRAVRLRRQRYIVIPGVLTSTRC